jgi:hypothetical protein
MVSVPFGTKSILKNAATLMRLLPQIRSWAFIPGEILEHSGKNIKIPDKQNYILSELHLREDICQVRF